MDKKQYPEAVAAFTASREAYLKLASLRVGERVRAVEMTQQAQDAIKALSGVDARGRTGPGANRRLDLMRDLERIKREDDGPLEVPAEISLALAGAWFRGRNLAEAERENLNARRVRPDFGQAHNNLAVIYMMTGRYTEAQSAIKKAEECGFEVSGRLKDDLARRMEQP